MAKKPVKSTPRRAAARPKAQGLPTIVVLDASFVLRFVLHTQSAQPDATGLEALRECELIVPALWNIEVASALLQTERRKAANAARLGDALAKLMALNPQVDTQAVSVARNLECARAHGLTAYDSLYFELALRRRAALATCDAAMIAAAPAAGIRLYPTPVIPSN
jgi:predicted nucleic acid-binding protein